jgi:hypothetical protein
MSIRTYATLLCPLRLLTLDALQDFRPEPRRIVYTIFGLGLGSSLYFGKQFILWAFVCCLLVTEFIFRSMIFGFLLMHLLSK